MWNKGEEPSIISPDAAWRNLINQRSGSSSQVSKLLLLNYKGCGNWWEKKSTLKDYHDLNSKHTSKPRYLSHGSKNYFWRRSCGPQCSKNVYNAQTRFTSTHGHTSVGRPAITWIHQSLRTSKDLPREMVDRDG